MDGRSSFAGGSGHIGRVFATHAFRKSIRRPAASVENDTCTEYLNRAQEMILNSRRTVYSVSSQEGRRDRSSWVSGVPSNEEDDESIFGLETRQEARIRRDTTVADLKVTATQDVDESTQFGRRRGHPKQWPSKGGTMLLEDFSPSADSLSFKQELTDSSWSTSSASPNPVDELVKAGNPMGRGPQAPEASSPWRRRRHALTQDAARDLHRFASQRHD